ncbi:hypothetical protein FHS86_002148 [Roseimarinus sediminis]
MFMEDWILGKMEEWNVGGCVSGLGRVMFDAVRSRAKPV